MHCQVCNTFSDKDIGEYNELTGKMDFICGKCNDSHHETRQDYKALDEMDEEEEFYDFWDDDQDYWGVEDERYE